MWAYFRVLGCCSSVGRWLSRGRWLGRPRALLIRLVLATATVIAALAVAGCGGSSHPAQSLGQGPSNTPAALFIAPSQWPDAADYETLKVAVGVRDQALLHEADWRRKAGEATAAMLTLMSLRGHLLPGTCATFVNDLYDELWSLSDGYDGEDWRPLVLWVKRHPAFEASCRRPPDRGPGL
jgi:hypothetical protein